MSQEEKKISFGVRDNGFTAFMEKAKGEFTKLRKEAQSIYSVFAEEAKKDSLSFKDKTRFIQDQLKALREQLKVEKELTQEKLKQNKLDGEALQGNKTPWAKKRRDELIEEETGLSKRMSQLNRRTSAVGEAGVIAGRAAPQGGSFFTDLIKAELFKDLVGLVRGMPNARTGVDLVGSAFSGAGAAAGGLLGPIGAYLGKEVGGFLGDAVTRSRHARNEYGQAMYGFLATTGQDGGDLPGARRDIDIDRGVLNKSFVDPRGIRPRAGLAALRSRFTNLGFTDAEALQAMTRTSHTAGGSGGAEDAAALMLGLGRSHAIDEGTTMSGLRSGRFGGGNGASNILRTLSMAVAQGLDSTRFADAIHGQVQLMEKFAGVSTNVDVNRANSVLFGLNRGEFGIGDTRAAGNLSALQSGLSEPGSAFGQAQNYAVLRRLFPGANAWELRKKQQQGLMTPGFLEGVMGDIKGGTGSEEFQKFQMQGRFSGLSMAAIDTLWSGGKLTAGAADKQLKVGDIESQAAKYTTTLQVQQAEIQNAFKDSFALGIKQVASAFTDEMIKAVREIASFASSAFSSDNAAESKFDSRGNIIQKSDMSKTPGARGLRDPSNLSKEQAEALRQVFK